jgi:hypothetical protein
MQSITATEIADPSTRSVSLLERVCLTVDWFTSRPAPHCVREISKSSGVVVRRSLRAAKRVRTCLKIR